MDFLSAVIICSLLAMSFIIFRDPSYCRMLAERRRRALEDAQQ